MTSDELSKSDSNPQGNATFGATQNTDASTATGGGSTGGKSDWTSRIDALKQQEADLKRSIADLQATYNRLTQDQFKKIQSDINRMVQQGTADLEQRKRTLQMEIEKLERRQIGRAHV